eukprot:CAMPEP_0119366412 /NCGR_PEP_ID=MMETSP1334-20130426/13274_1 /TAXON_ID=127549 /ORGANISM="Calcidiscus leptoporus, Strain RCC1130" /LENGTH=66 /DNA_ID=CAMNT_0007382615 /DNA_START=273 /DNA_END=473 /DNA_ORIENTATION=-
MKLACGGLRHKLQAALHLRVSLVRRQVAVAAETLDTKLSSQTAVAQAVVARAQIEERALSKSNSIP